MTTALRAAQRKIERRRAALTATAITGADLDRARQAAGVHSAAIARLWQVSRQYVHKIEIAPSVPPDTAERYLEAVRHLHP